MSDPVRTSAPPRVDMSRLRQGPSAADLQDIPPTSAADWEDAELLVPVDPETWKDFLAFRENRRRSSR